MQNLELCREKSDSGFFGDPSKHGIEAQERGIPGGGQGDVDEEVPSRGLNCGFGIPCRGLGKGFGQRE